MKTLIPKSLASFTCAAALFMAPLANLQASDDPNIVFLDSDPSIYTGFWDIAGAPGGEVYAVGFVIENDDPAYEVVLRSLDRGATWDTASVVTDSHGTFINAAVDGGTNLYVVTSGSGGGTGGEVWRSAAPHQGANLRRVTTFNDVLPSGYRLRTETLAADAAGNVFVAGYRPVTSGRTTLARWMVARGTPTAGGGLNWSVVDEFTVDSKYGSFATGLAVRPSNDQSAPSEVWVRGTVGSKSGDRVVLRRSVQSGAPDTWQTSATYSGDTRWERGIGVKSLAVGGAGQVYDVGMVKVALSRKLSENRWATWRLAPGASNVEIVDQLTVSSAAYKVAVDALGRVYVQGGRSGFDGSVVRASVNGNSGSWGDYDLAENASFYGMNLDNEGSLYLAGELCEPDACLGYVRKSPAP
ncbi:MAG: hypothetical protein KIS67_02690 [Verrucomicrobiae bacterium]|nr:hypothetical protein [Verrucomicrobiae bacterium]